MNILKNKFLGKIIYGLIGAALIVSTVATSDFGLPKVDKDIYSKAVDLEETDSFGFENFKLSDYKVRFYNGSCDYVAYADSITKENARFDVFVGTTIEIDGEYQVVVPTFKRFSKFINTLDTAESVIEGSTVNNDNEYTMDSHVSTIWHEAFHAWQFSRWERDIKNLTNDIDDNGANSQENVLKSIDSNEEYVVSFNEEMALLHEAYNSDSIEVKKELINSIIDATDKRQAALNHAQNEVEYYLENIEGSAMYVESLTYKEIKGEDAFKEYYTSDFTYSDGTGKYYKLGMMKALLLDQVMPDWKNHFNPNYGFDSLLKESIDK